MSSNVCSVLWMLESADVSLCSLQMTLRPVQGPALKSLKQSQHRSQLLSISLSFCFHCLEGMCAYWTCCTALRCDGICKYWAGPWNLSFWHSLTTAFSSTEDTISMKSLQAYYWQSDKKDRDYKRQQKTRLFLWLLTSEALRRQTDRKRNWSLCKLTLTRRAQRDLHALWLLILDFERRLIWGHGQTSADTAIRSTRA